MLTLSVKTANGRILKPGDEVYLGKNGTNKITGKMVGKVINRRNKRTGFTTHFANVLGSVWVKYGNRETGEKILQLMPDLLDWIPKKPKKSRESVDKIAILDTIEFEL